MSAEIACGVRIPCGPGSRLVRVQSQIEEDGYVFCRCRQSGASRGRDD